MPARPLLALSALLIAAAVPAAANAQANCETYGKLALQQQKDNEANKCGFTGPDWSTDLKGHVEWCSKVGPDKWKEQIQSRNQALAGCATKK
jgi:hypothetical protein